MTPIRVISDVYSLIHRPLPLNLIVHILIRIPMPARPYLLPVEPPRDSNLISNRHDAI
jgi:hypothetical protein